MNETYKAIGRANRTTFLEFEGTSKREVIKVIRQQTEAKRVSGHASSWTVYRTSDGAAVAAGGVDSDDIRYRIPDDYLFNLTNKRT